MSNISRRKFLKGAGAAALAVAATGVLAGCSKDDTPVIPDLTKEVKVIFMCDGAPVGKDGSVVVGKDARLFRCPRSRQSRSRRVILWRAPAS